MLFPGMDYVLQVYSPRAYFSCRGMVFLQSFQWQVVSLPFCTDSLSTSSKRTEKKTGPWAFQALTSRPPHSLTRVRTQGSHLFRTRFHPECFRCPYFFSQDRQVTLSSNKESGQSNSQTRRVFCSRPLLWYKESLFLCRKFSKVFDEVSIVCFFSSVDFAFFEPCLSHPVLSACWKFHHARRNGVSSWSLARE